MSHSSPWRSAMPPLELQGGLAVAHYRMRFAHELTTGRIIFPRAELKQHFDGAILDEQGVGFWHDQPVYVLELNEAELPSDCFDWVGARQFMLQGETATYKLLAFASQIGTWSREHRYCGGCGQPMHSSRAHRMRYCTPCGLQQYPRISPCMIVVVSKGDEILLARSPRFIPGMYSALAGYAEPGETIEQCVHREVMEETQIEIQTPKYITSQNWPFPHSMMLGFHAQYLRGDIVPELDEIEDAQWFNIHQLPPLPAPGSIARYLIDLYLHQRLGGIEPVLPY